jgi:hypothetical protein
VSRDGATETVELANRCPGCFEPLRLDAAVVTRVRDHATGRLAPSEA